MNDDFTSTGAKQVMDTKLSELDLIPVRSNFSVGRRGLLKGVAAVAAGSAMGLPQRADAATTLNFLGWQGYDTFLEASNFAKTSGTSLQKSYISNADEIIAKLRLDSSSIDICTPYFIHDHFLADGNLIQPIDLTKVPNFKNIDAVILDQCKKNMAKGDVWFATPMTFGSNCMVYNSAKAAVPTSWTDLLKPEHKGKCALTTDFEGNIYLAAKVNGVVDPNFMTRAELKTAIDWLINLKKNHLRTIAASYGDLVNLLSSNEVIIAQGWEPVADWVGKAAPIKTAYPRETCMGFIEGYAIGKGSTKVDAALAFINNALSVPGQLAGSTANSMPCTVTAAMQQSPAEYKTTYSYGDLGSYFAKARIMKMYPLDDDGIHATWDEYLDGWEKVMKA
jgi:spermidine/putrescine transport system substrate-binding protein